MYPTKKRYSWFDARDAELRKEALERYPHKYRDTHGKYYAVWHFYHCASDRLNDVYHKLYVE